MSPNLRGIVLMTAAMTAFAIEDAIIKLSSPALPLGQVLVISCLVGLPVFGWFARRQRARLTGPALWHPAMVGRNLGEMVGTAGYVIGLTVVPLTTAVAIFQAMPLAVVAGAALFLNEKVGWRRWTAICVGFLGVLIVIRPGWDGFDLATLWPLLAVLGLSVRDICTRAAPAGLPTPLLAAWSYGAILILGLAMTAMDGWVWPSATQTIALALIVACGMVGIWLLTAATRVGDMGAVMPFRYSRLVVALALGFWLFGERPDLVTWGGMALIIGAGLYTFLRERALSKAARPG